MTVADILRAAQWVPGVVNAALSLIERHLAERERRRQEPIRGLDPRVIEGVYAFLGWAVTTSAPDEEQGAYGVCLFLYALQYQVDADDTFGKWLTPAELEALQNR